MVSAYKYTTESQEEFKPLMRKEKSPSGNRRIWKWALCIVALAMVSAITYTLHMHIENVSFAVGADGKACPQFPALKALSEERGMFEKEMRHELESHNFFNKSLKRMQGAIQIATESFDDMGEIGEDNRWDVFIEFHEYLEQTFPLM